MTAPETSMVPTGNIMRNPFLRLSLNRGRRPGSAVMQCWGQSRFQEFIDMKITFVRKGDTTRGLAIAAIVAFGAIGSVSMADAATSVLKLHKTSVDGCQKFVTPNGKTWKAVGKIVVQGACPADLKGTPTIHGEVLDAHSIKLANGSVCRFDDHGKGRCS